MKKSNNQTLEVLEPEVEEIPLEQVIDNTLVKHNVTDAVISSLKAKYGGMQLKSLDDKESYLDIKEARKEVRKIGILTEKLCKKGREDAVAIQRKWLAKEKEILGKIEEVENPLNIEIEKFENEVERKELAEKKRQEEIYINRQTALSRMGASYDNGSYVLNHISYEIELIKAADEDLWNDTIYPKYKREFEAVEAQRVMEENKRKEEIESMRKQQEELQRQQKELREAQELMSKQKEELEKAQRLEQEKTERIERQKRQELIGGRINQIGQLGFLGNGINEYYFGDKEICILMEDIQSMPTEKWDALIAEITPTVEKVKRESYEKLVLEQEKKKAIEIELALQKERERVAEANRQAEMRKQQEEAQKAEELAKSGDKVRWQHFLAQLNAIQVPQMNSGIYRGKVAILKEKLEEVNSL